MKKTIFTLLLVAFVAVPSMYAQAVLGTYEQETLIAPDEYRDSEDDVSITKDPKSSKKIWIHNLIPNQKFYAVINTKGEETTIYAVPKQVAGNYQINLGCVIYKTEDSEVIIALNNETNCFGISQKDYDQDVSVSSGGISGGGVTVGSDGTIATKVGSVSKDGVKMNTRKIMEGIQYIGTKM